MWGRGSIPDKPPEDEKGGSQTAVHVRARSVSRGKELVVSCCWTVGNNEISVLISNFQVVEKI